MQRIWLACWLVLFCASVDAKEESYVELVTPELTVVSGVSEGRTRELAFRISTFRAALQQAVGVQLTPAMPLRIYALRSRDWQRYAQPRAGISGYFVAQPFASDLIFDAQAATPEAHELMFHEYVHYVLRTFWTTPEIPAFLDEGLAEVLSTARLGKGSVRIGPRPDQIRFLERNEWLPFERLLSVKRHDPEYLDHELAPAFYAQAWATMYFAMTTGPELGERMAHYARELNAGKPPIQAAERFIGARGGEANRDIAAHLRKRSAPGAKPMRVIAASREPADVSLRSLSADESDLALGELMLRLAGHEKSSLELFEKVLERSPRSTRARAGTAWALFMSGERPQAASAFDALARIADLDPRRGDMDAATRIAIARGLFQVAAAESQESDRPTAINRARFTKARTLFEGELGNETHRLEAVNGYVLTCLALEEYPEGLLELAQSAYSVAPKSSVLAVSLALLHEINGGTAAARRYWEEAARSSHTAPLRARALQALERAPAN